MPNDEDTTQVREDEAVERRIRGESYREIGRALGFAGGSGALKAVRRGLRRLPVPDAAEVRVLEIRRVEALYSRAWQRAEAADWPVSWIRILLEIADRLHRLHGLFALGVSAGGAPRQTILDVLSSPAFVAWRRQREEEDRRPIRDVEVSPDVAAVTSEHKPRKVVGLGRRLPHEPEATPCGAEPAVDGYELADVDASAAPAESVPATDEAVTIYPETPGGVEDLNGTCEFCGGIGCGECRTRGGTADEYRL